MSAQLDEYSVLREVGTYQSGVEVRPWRSGDGLHCTGGKKGLLNCGRPAAVMRVIDNSPGKWRPASRTYVLCANHLARKARELCGDGGTGSVAGEATARAREQVIADHWDEYQALFAQYAREARENWLGLLPEALRAAAEAAIDDEVQP